MRLRGLDMVTVVDESLQVQVPGWVQDLSSFRRWTDSSDFPEEGRIWWLKAGVWIDLSREQVFTHVLVKTEITSVLGVLVKQEKSGLLLGDGVRLSNTKLDFSGVPDAVFVSFENLKSGKVELLEGAEGGYVEIQGSPDMVLEVVSKASVKKDTQTLRETYWEAGIHEYWIVDARGDLRFDLLRHAPRGYVATRKQDGWLKSNVFNRQVRLTQSQDPLGNPSYALESRPA